MYAWKLSLVVLDDAILPVMIMLMFCDDVDYDVDVLFCRVVVAWMRGIWVRVKSYRPTCIKTYKYAFGSDNVGPHFL